MIFSAAVDVATYSVGDYVYTKPGRGGTPRLARIESAHALRSNEGPVWLVRQRMRASWASAQIHLLIDRPLNDLELTHCRRLGLIPAHGEPL